MKTIFVTLIALLINFPTFAQPTENQRIELRNEICAVWAKNAMYGATQRIRGAKRDVQWINTSILMELIEHRKGADALYFIDNEYTPLQREWIVSSTLEGYDWMDKRFTPTGQLPDPVKVSEQFFETCRNDSKHYHSMLESIVQQ